MASLPGQGKQRPNIWILFQESERWDTYYSHLVPPLTWSLRPPSPPSHPSRSNTYPGDEALLKCFPAVFSCNTPRCPTWVNPCPHLLFVPTLRHLLLSSVYQLSPWMSSLLSEWTSCLVWFWCWASVTELLFQPLFHSSKTRHWWYPSRLNSA